MARCFCQHGIEGGDRFSRTPQVEQQIAAIVERIEMARRERQRLVDLRQRLVAALERVQHEREVRQRIGRPGRKLERGADQPIGLARFAALVVEHAKQMQGVEVVALRLEHARVKFFRFVQPVLRVQRDRLRSA